MPCDMLVFGGTGDLALHKLLPALYHLHRENRLPKAMRIIGISRKVLPRASYIELAERHCRAQIEKKDFIESSWLSFSQRLDYLAMDAAQAADFSRLTSILKCTPEHGCIYYLATAPHLFESIAANLALTGLAGANTRIVIEKPIGHSLPSALNINAAIGAAFSEEQVFRIDHYLGKETVQNLMALRFANALFEPVWRAAHIDHVQITVNETIGVENSTLR